MLFSSHSHDQYPREFDEHNAITEPLISPQQPSYPVSPVYPVLPHLPATAKNKNWRRPAGGAPHIPHVPYVSSIPPVSPYYPVATPQPVQKKRSRPSAFPSLVGLFFVAVQLLLLVRFLLKLIGLWDNVSWVAIVYTVSNIFVFPFRLILQNILLPLPIPASLELYTLLAILIYGLLARILVPILKAILR